MRKVISIFLPQWPIEARNRRLPQRAAWQDKPFVIGDLEAQRQSVLAVNAAAARQGILVGMSVSNARAIFPDVYVAPSQPNEDARALRRLTLGCLRFSPLVAPALPDGIWIDVTGVARLFGGETAMLEKIAKILRRNHLTVRGAMASTPGAAWAWSHYGHRSIVLPDSLEDMNPLPVTALRLSTAAADGLWRVGIKTIGALRKIPRATIPLRFGADVLKRLDQAFGLAPEIVDPLLPPSAKQRRLAFVEPISAREDLERTLRRLTEEVCDDLEKSHEGARKLDLTFHRVDGQQQTLRAGTARPSRDCKHLFKLFVEKLETIDPGFGIESAVLTAWRVDPLVPSQMHTAGMAADNVHNLGELVDLLANRVGGKNVHRLAPIASDIPERAVKRINPVAVVTASWPQHLPRPLRLLSPPEIVSVTALLPDHPPARFSWRGQTHKVRCADGPERIFGEWWQSPQEVAETRDYFRVEDEQGERYWLFRDNRLSTDQNYRWYLHGIFA